MASKRFDAVAGLCALAALGVWAAPAGAQVVINETFDGPNLTCPAGWTCTPVISEADPNAPGLVDNRMVLTLLVDNLSASVFHNTPQNIQTNRFKATFQIQINGVADGMTFAVIDAAAGADYRGAGGGGLGWGGAVQGFAVEFDIFENDDVDPGATDHVGVNLNGSLRSVATSSGAAGPGIEFCPVGGFELGADSLFDVEVAFDNGHIEVYLTGGVLAGRTKMIDADIPPFPTDQALFGFTGATGGSNAFQRVDNFTLELFSDISDPPPSPGPLPSPFAVNCGSGARVEEPLGNPSPAVFEPDQRWVDGSTRYGWYGSFGEDAPEGSGNNACFFPNLLSLNVPADPPGLEDVYNSLRFGPANANFGYRFLVENGTYEVTLYFMEPSGFYGALDIEGALLLLPLCYGADLTFSDAPGSSGLRRMDIALEGVKVLENFSLIDLRIPADPLRAHLAGVREGPIVVRTAQRPGYATLDPISVINGVLDVDFLLHDTGIVEDLAGPAISGIKIERVGPAGVDPRPPVVAAVDTLVIQDGRRLPDGSGAYNGTRDTTIQEKRPDGNNGKAEHLELGRTADDPEPLGDPDDDRSILLRFTGLADLVNNSTMAGRELVSATITLDYFSSRPTNDDDIGYQGNGGDYLEGGHCPAVTVLRADLLPACAPFGLAPFIPFPPAEGVLDQEAFCAGTRKIFNPHELLTLWEEGVGSDETDGQVVPGGTGATWNRPRGAASDEWTGASRALDFVPASLATLVLTDPIQMNLGAANPDGAGFTSVMSSFFNGVEIIPLPAYMPIEIDVTDLARTWIAGNENPGLLIRDDPNSPPWNPADPNSDPVNALKGTRTFKSREWPSILDRPSLTLVFVECVEPLSLSYIGQGEDDRSDHFNSVKRFDVEMVAVPLKASRPVTLDSFTAESSDGTVFTSVTLGPADANGEQTLSFTPKLEPLEQARFTLEVSADAGGVGPAGGACTATFTVLVGHLPDDFDQSDDVTISDITRFSILWRNLDPDKLMLDHDASGVLSATDVTLTGASFTGNLGSDAHAGKSLNTVP